jgi:tetratricopeptide (TPR) repeat protein
MEREEEALAAFEQSLSIKPDRVVALVNASEMARRLKKLEKALELARKAVAINAEYALGWQRLGLALEATGKPDEGAEALKRATELEFRNEAIAQDYLMLLGRLKRFADLKAAAEARIKSFPDLPFGHFWLAQAHFSLGDLEAGLRCLREASLLDEASEYYYNAYSDSLSRQGRYEDMKAFALMRLATHPKFRAACFALGLAEAQLGRLEESLKAYLKALEIDPDYDRGLIGAAEMCNRMLKFADARKYASRLLELKKDNVPAVYQLACAEEGLENYDSAIELYTRAQKLYGRKDSFAGEIDRARRLQRVGLLRKENAQPKNAAQCYDLYWVEAYFGRLRHACAWARKLYEEFGGELKTADDMFLCAWIEMKALGALQKKTTETAPQSPAPPPLEQSEDGHRNQCLKVLRRLLEMGYELEKVKLDPTFNALHATEGWKKLLADFKK